MHDGSSAVISTTAYARIYEEQQPRLVAYARSLTRNAWLAEDLVAEAHFRVWRRLAEGHEIDNVSAYLTTTVRHLAYAASGATREMPRDPHEDEPAEAGRHGDDPAEQVSSVDLLVRVLAQLPERWVKALWLAEAEGQPLAQIGPQLGTKEGATAVLLHRAREGMRQAFLRTQTGAPDDPACQVHWSRMPAYVRGAATERQSDRLLGHVDTCEDCRTRLAALMRANDRLPALAGPALLVFAVGGAAGKFLLTLTAAGASAGAHAGAGGGGGGLLHGVRQATTVGGTKAPVVVAAGAMVVGAAALVLILGPGQSSSVPAQRTPVADAPVAQVPVAGTPAVPTDVPTTEPAAVAEGSDGAGTAEGAAGPVRTVGSDPSDTTGVTPAPGGSGSGSGGDDGGGDTAAPPETTAPSPSPSPSQPADPTPPAEPTEPAPPSPPAESEDPTPPAEPTDPAPVDPPPAEPTDPVTPPDDDCPPPPSDTSGNGNGNGDHNGKGKGKGNGRKGNGGGGAESDARIPAQRDQASEKDG
ncbi:sigma-70 family RNA polymerase sigma factor [Streptomyces sp. NPDC051016]|uniref:sigma-70 family RNA polymerase sigma factor n=1 Tax=Streptomyces sp. NPDC051016 TaxID=3365638 RepID=UPI003797900E